MNNWWRDFGEGEKTFSILKEHVGEKLIIFDTETTGLDPKVDTIIQLSAIKCTIDKSNQFHEVDRLNTYINPQKKLPSVITKITGITDEMLSLAPIEEDIWPTIYDFFKDGCVLCGHNVQFDIGMLSAMYKRHNKQFALLSLDTLTMARELHRKNEAGSHKLGDLASYFGLDYGLEFHNSIDDVVATTRLLRFFIEEYLEKANEPVTVKIAAKVKSCWAWSGYNGMQRLYVKVVFPGEARIIWVNQRRPYEWGEKDKNSLELFDMKNIENQVLSLYRVSSLEELSKVRESRFAS